MIKALGSAFIAAAMAVGVTAPASAALFVSGDGNIFGAGAMPFANLSANQQFLRNIAGTNVLIQDSAQPFFTVQMPMVQSYLTGNGIAVTTLSNAASLTAADFTGRSLFIAYVPDDGYGTSEVAAISAFLASGANVLVAGDNDLRYRPANDRVNQLLLDLGSTMSLGQFTLDPGYNPATSLSSNVYTQGTAGFQFAAATSVVGGIALYGSLDGTPIISVDRLPAVPGVPEPASWALLIGGFAMTGATLRRRRGAAA
jgi:hypothetical protein